jgi:hypothetical protein
VISGLERLVKHGVRLDILCCLDGEALTVPEIGTKIGRGERHVSHHMRLLDSFGLVDQGGETESGEPLYVTCLGEHPTWVTRAVNEHRLAS